METKTYYIIKVVNLETGERDLATYEIFDDIKEAYGKAEDWNMLDEYASGAIALEKRYYVDELEV